MKTILCALLATLLLTGCETAPKSAVASGRQEIVVTGKTPDQVRSIFVKEMVNQGFLPGTADPLNLTFDRKLKSFAGVMAYGPDYDTKAWQRLRVNIIDLGAKGVKIIASGSAVTNRGAPTEQETELHGNNAPSIQALLAEIKTKIEGS